MKITISAHNHVEAFSGQSVPVYARVYCDTPFTNSDDETVGAGSIDSNNYVKQVSASYSAGVTTIASFATSNRIDSTTYGTGGVYARYTLTLHNAKGKRVAIVYSGLALDSTPTTTTWADIELWNNARQEPYRHAYYDTVQINALLDGLDLAPDATDVIIGKARLSYLQATLNDPIAVGNNDPMVRSLRQIVYLDEYGNNQAGLDAAISGEGANQVELKITSQISVTSNTTIPANILVTLEGGGSFTVASGRTLTITSFTPVAPKEDAIFTGVGTTKVLGGYLRVEWWTGMTDGTTNLTSGFDAAFTSASVTNTATLIDVGPGVWRLRDPSVIPSRTTIRGTGSGVNGSQGTVIMPLDNTAAYALKVSEAFRNITIENLTLSVGAFTAPNCFLASGTAPNSAFGLTFKNVCFHSTASTSAAQMRVADLGGAWELVGVKFDHCTWITPASTKSFHPSSINSLYTFDTCVWVGAAGYIANYIEAMGFAEYINPDFRGPGSFASSTTLDRTITGSYDGGTQVLTLSTGSLTENDIGQRFVVGSQDAQITGLLTSTTASTNGSGVSAGEAALAIYRYTPSTSMARACFEIVGDHATINIHGGADEGFQYFLINDASTNVSPINVFGGFIQSTVWFKDACVMNLYGTRLYSQTFTDDSGVTASVFSHGCSLDRSAINLTTGGVVGIELSAARLFGVQAGDSLTYTDLNFHEGLQEQSIGVKTSFIDKHTAARTTPLVVIGSASQTVGGPDQPFLHLTRLDPVTMQPDYGYKITRNYDDSVAAGHLQFTGNQEIRYRGYDFDANIKAVSFTGGVLSPAQITSNQNDWAPADQSEIIRVSTDASRNITGLLYGFPPNLAGNKHQIWNVGSFNVVLQHQNASSTASARFICDTGADITVRPNERVLLVYDLTTARWRVSKLNIAGLTSNGTTVTSSIAFTSTGAFTASSTAAIVGVTTVGAGSAFDLSMTPSGGGVGVFDVGSSAAGLVLNEGGGPGLGTATLTSDAIGLVGPITTAVKSSSATGGVGYTTGAGGAQTQATSKATTVVSNTVTTAITMHNANLAAGTAVSFTFTNSAIASTDHVIVDHVSAGTAGAYTFAAFPGSGSASVTVRNVTAGDLAEAIVIRVTVIKAVSS